MAFLLIKVDILFLFMGKSADIAKARKILKISNQTPVSGTKNTASLTLCRGNFG